MSLVHRVLTSRDCRHDSPETPHTGCRKRRDASSAPHVPPGRRTRNRPSLLFRTHDTRNRRRRRCRPRPPRPRRQRLSRGAIRRDLENRCRRGGGGGAPRDVSLPAFVRRREGRRNSFDGAHVWKGKSLPHIISTDQPRPTRRERSHTSPS